MSDQPTTPPEQGAPAPEQPQPTPSTAPGTGEGQRDAADAPLGETGLKALNDEREARKALERELRPLKETMAKLNGLFGGEKAPEGADLVTTLQERVSQMERDNLVNAVARRHGITDEADVDFLRTAKDEPAMTALATRLATPSSTTPQPPTPPQPDPGQGDRAPAQSQEDAEYAAFYPSTK